ncbi:hypothetical protein NQ317_000861 [Molorchus minor]|uniref:Uncharacterized protein n=1 Tax=Molorchus minor TaxID=1323400 RepID=A0ABQ9JTN4_9CUCU|nr:hypothetical protein NQ317_000861 [Molorchus minor]
MNLTTGEPTLKHSTIEELKSKLETKEDVDETATTMIPDTLRNPGHHPPPPLLSDDGLIMPRKPANPVKENTERQNLHKELLFNQKM